MRTLLTLLVLALPAATRTAAQPADLILVGARVWTADSARPFAEAVAVVGWDRRRMSCSSADRARA